MSEIVKCNCPNPGQDKIYGPGYRLMNEKGTGGLRCTVCGIDHADIKVRTITKKK